MCSDFKSCPICGGDVTIGHINSDTLWWKIECTKCHCYMPFHTNEHSAEGMKKVWNGRVSRSEAVRSCPICGDIAVHWGKDGENYVACQSGTCGFRTPRMKSQKAAAYLWNGKEYTMDRESSKYDERMKPCPFCGHKKPIVIFTDGHYHVFCPSCQVTTCAEATPDKAIDSWNHRSWLEEAPDLDLCPFCGSRVDLYHDVVGTQDQYSIQCPSCKSCLSGGTNRDSLIEEWNTRSLNLQVLRPCPLCGEPAEFWEDTGGWYARCTVDYAGCSLCTPVCKTKEEAAAIWNGIKKESD